MFSATELGGRSKYQDVRSRLCMWCGPQLLSTALGTRMGNGKVVQALKKFWRYDRAIFERALARIPAEQREAFSAAKIMLSRTFHSEEASPAALAVQNRQNKIIQRMRVWKASDMPLYDLPMAMIPWDERGDLRAKIDIFPRAKQQAAKARAKAAAPQPTWPDASPATSEEEEYAERVAEDENDARARFFPKRAPTWEQRSVDLPRGLAERDVPLAGILPDVDDAACDETGLPVAGSRST